MKLTQNQYYGKLEERESAPEGSTFTATDTGETFVSAGGNDWISTSSTDSSSYTVYTALVTNLGDGSDPTAVILENTTEATLTWSNDGSGRYNVTADSGIFTEDKTIAFYSLGDNAIISTSNQEWIWLSNTEIQFYVGVTIDRAFTDTAFEIRIYS